MKLKVYKTTLLLCIFVILLSFVMKLFGYTGFSIPIIDHAINNNLAIMYISYGLLFITNAILVILLIVKVRLKWKHYLIIIIIFLIEYIGTMLTTNPVLVIMIDINCLAAASYLITKDGRIVLEALIVSLLNILYQSISMFTKNLNIAVANETFTTNITFMIDYYMLLTVSILYFKRKEVHIYELVIELIHVCFRRPKTISILHSKRRCEEKCLQQSKTHVQEVEVGYLVFNIVLAIFQIMLVGFVSFLVKNTIVNFVIIYLSFIILRSVFKESYHADIVLKCTTMSMVIFACATELSLDVNISILSSVLVGLLVAFILHIAYYYENYIKCTNDITKLDLENLKLRLVYLEQIEIEMLYDYWHRGNTTVDEVAEKYGYNKMKIYRTLNKIKQD